MKILHITATHLSKSGGIPVVLDNLVRNQNKVKGVESRVLSLCDELKDISNESFLHIKKISEIQEYLKSYKPNFTIIHSLYFKEYIKVSRILKSNGYDYLIEPHSSFGRAAQKKSWIKKKIANRFFFKRFIKNAKGYIFLNESEMRDSIYRTENDIIIPNGVDSFLNSSLNEDSEEIKFYFLGRLDIVHKGLDILFNALQSLDKESIKFNIDFYGTGTENEVDFIKRNSLRLINIKSRYIGPIYGENKGEVLSKYDIMILTSRYEGFPVTVLEALSYGCPCIVSEGTNLKSLIESNELGWGCTTNDISETIKRAILEYRIKKINYREKVKLFIDENYTWDKIALLSLETLKDVNK